MTVLMEKEPEFFSFGVVFAIMSLVSFCAKPNMYTLTKHTYSKLHKPISQSSHEWYRCLQRDSLTHEIVGTFCVSSVRLGGYVMKSQIPAAV